MYFPCMNGCITIIYIKTFSIHCLLSKQITYMTCSLKITYMTCSNDFTRAPQSIQKHKMFWKPSKFRVWLLYYSLPLLLHILPPLYYHSALPVCAFHLLLQENVRTSDIDVAEEMLKRFLRPSTWPIWRRTLHRTVSYTFNYYVRLWGPLGTHSAFACEN